MGEGASVITHLLYVAWLVCCLAIFFFHRKEVLALRRIIVAHKSEIDSLRRIIAAHMFDD